jgi:hypothetical protein
MPSSLSLWRRFPPPWVIEEHPECFIVHRPQPPRAKLSAIFYYDDEPRCRLGQ